MAEIYFATSASFPGGFTELIRTKSLSQTWASSASLLRSGLAMGACARAPAAAKTAHATIKKIRLTRCNIAHSSERKFSHIRFKFIVPCTPEMRAHACGHVCCEEKL